MSGLIYVCTLIDIYSDIFRIKYISKIISLKLESNVTGSKSPKYEIRDVSYCSKGWKPMRLFVNFCNLEGDSAQYLLGCYPTSVWTSLPNNISYFIDIKSVNKITKFKEKNNNKRTFFPKSS